jgi:hypothetical protein
MLRSYRGIVIAVGLIIADPSYGQQDGANQPKVSGDTAGQLARVDAAAEKRPVPSAPDQGCQPGENDRQSDLCAQWKAADAAAESARWALWALWIGGLGLLVGGGTLFAAWRAAHWAKKAADHTESGSGEARRAADATIEAVKEAANANKLTRELARPWVSITCKFTRCELLGLHLMVDGELTYKNVGATPALDFTSYYRCNFNTDQESDKTTEFIRRLDGARGYGNSLMPSEEIVEPFFFELPYDDEAVFEDENTKDRLLQILVTAVLTYRAPGRSSWQGPQTARSFVVTRRDGSTVDTRLPARNPSVRPENLGCQVTEAGTTR